MGGLLPPIGHPLLGQRLTQPGMLVVHVPLLLVHRSVLHAGQLAPDLLVPPWCWVASARIPAGCRRGSFLVDPSLRPVADSWLTARKRRFVLAAATAQ
jgi:hypothetical protein